MLNKLVNCTKLLTTLTSLVGVLGASVIPLPALSQSIPSRYDTVISQTTTNSASRVVLPPIKGNGISGIVNYPYGSRINTGGVVTTPNGTVMPPSVTVNNGDGSVTYYYRNGSQINTNGTKIKPIGIPITR